MASVSFSVQQERDKEQKGRFETELEFVQSLANPNYLNCESARESMV